MSNISRRTLLATASAAAGFALPLARSARAETYPSRSVRVIVPYAAGGTTDFAGRVVCEKMGQIAGQAFFVENKTGAAGAIGMKDVAGSTPDGYSLLFMDSTMAVTPSMNPQAGIEPLKMFRPVGIVGLFPSVLVVHPGVPAKTVAELVAYAKANPGKINFGSGGVGTVPHLQGEQFRLVTGAPIQHVPYRGAAAALQDVVAGQIQMLFTAAPTALSFIRGGQLKLIATTGAERLPVVSEAPTLAESGYKDLVSLQWFGLLAPAKTPEPIVTRLAELLTQALQDPVTSQKITDQGGFLKIGKPADFASFIEAEIKLWGDVVKGAKLAN
jgi:tripartite-type tricarboxylate transporter receptor subunit TctC